MVIRPALKRQQFGATLVELMISSILGIVVIGSVGSVFISGQNIASERSKELLLLQQVSGTLQYFKEDIQRAGYDGGTGMSLKLSGATNTLYISPDSKIVAFAYAHQSEIRNVAFVFDSGLVKVCDSPSSIVKTVSAATSGCSSIFEPNQIRVIDFNVNQSSVEAQGVSSGMATITISAELVGDTSVNYSSSVIVKNRNWR
ncbi:PilW family protein [Vibrio sp. 10N.222.55.A3]|uniref:PilW family protein n=1 Tax=unclassified Vibrio TaxID=2614977 RepID=UPI001493625B|nr:MULTISPECIES: pilus assembly protein PilW [unclassified Vibrio]MCC4890621.1 pilus assembly protein PilW [Vibrio sp. F13]NOH92402.1 pilus assembly protein PilW [Vibrio sp. AIC-3]